MKEVKIAAVAAWSAALTGPPGCRSWSALGQALDQRDAVRRNLRRTASNTFEAPTLGRNSTGSVAAMAQKQSTPAGVHEVLMCRTHACIVG
jgi:hypothetical protein